MFHGVENYFLGLWDTGMSDAILNFQFFDREYLKFCYTLKNSGSVC